MVDSVNPATRALVAMALDAANLRQVTHASNIAMASSAGYQAGDVEFEAHLDTVREAIASGQLSAADLDGLQARQITVSSAQGAVQLDQEVGAMSRNALHYQALVKLLSKHYATIGLATEGGRR